MLKNFLFFGFTILNCLAFAGNIKIAGYGAVYAGESVVVFGLEDYISEKREVLASGNIGANGHFEVSFEANETRQVFLSINRIEGVLYVEPGKEYTVVFPEPATAEIRRFDRTRVDLGLDQLDSTDLNLLVRRFNADLSGFIDEHYYDFAVEEYQGSRVYLEKIGGKKMEADIYKGSENATNHRINSKGGNFKSVKEQFFIAINSKYENMDTNEFFADYRRFSLAGLDLLAGMDRKDFYREYFMSVPLKLQQPAYMNSFEMFYHNFLSGNAKEKQAEVVRAINVEHDAQLLVEIFAYDSSALSQSVRTLAVIKGLGDVYFDRTFTRSAIERTLEGLRTSDPQLLGVAENTLSELKKCKEGWAIEDFTLVDDANDKWILSEHLGKPLYILFFAKWNTGSLKEMQLLQKLHEKYSKDVDFVAICMDPDYETFRKYLEENREQKFTFLFGKSDPLLTEKCGVRSLPHAIMLDSDGKVMFPFTRKPGEGIQLEFDKIKARNEKGTGNKTWKD